jgi:hypothetical protein
MERLVLFLNKTLRLSYTESFFECFIFLVFITVANIKIFVQKEK